MMPCVDDETPLFSAAQAFLRRDVASFTTPGHGRGDLADTFLSCDVPLSGGADDLRLSGDLLGRAERLAAAAWQADTCRFLVNGSTQGNQALLLALTPRSRVVVSRGAHRSVLSGLALADLDPVWVRPAADQHTGLPGAVRADQISDALRSAPDASAVFLTEPSYLGVVSDLEAIADTCHAHDVPLLVDGAWGAHFGFHPAVPACVLTRGADAVVVSTHKTLPAFTQSALLLTRGSRVDAATVGRALDLVETTSPSASIYASVDRARWLFATRGGELLGRAIANANRIRDALGPVDGVEIAHSDDPTKIVVLLAGTGADGFAVESDLEQAGIRVEMLDRDLIVPLVHGGTQRAWVDRVVAVLPDAIERHRRAPRAARLSAAFNVDPDQACSPREAFWAPRQRVAASRAVGRIAAETVTPYPPGIPAIAPGERITSVLVDALRAERDAGTRMAYCADATLDTLMVLR
jgi:arginine decarboxylase